MFLFCFFLPVFNFYFCPFWFKPLCMARVVFQKDFYWPIILVLLIWVAVWLIEEVDWILMIE